jgi:ligand-binding sensor domain-containing protein
MMLAGGGSATAQGEYQWSVYSALNSVQGVAFDSSGALWVATTGGVVGVSADTFTIYRTTEGLLSLNVTAVAFDPATGEMYVGAADGTINIRRRDGTWRYATEIASKTELPSRQINGFGFRNGRIYVLTDFGVGVYDPVAGNFVESYFNLGPVRQNSPVYAIAFWNDRIWLGTGGGLVSASISESNLAVPNVWSLYADLPPTRINSLVAIGDRLYIGSDSGAYVATPGGYSRRPDLPTNRVIIAGTGSAILASSNAQIYRYRNDAFVEGPLAADKVTALAISSSGIGGVGFAQTSLALLTADSLILRTPSAPAGNLFSDLTLASDGALWVASGGPGAESGNGVSRFKDGVWTQFTTANTPGLRKNQVWNVGGGSDGSAWAGTYGGSVTYFSQQNGTFTGTYYDSANSPIRGKNGTNEFPIVAKAATDASGRTWIVNFYNDETVPGSLLVVKLRKDEQGGAGGGGFVSFKNPFSTRRAYRWIAIDENGTKWIGSDLGSDGLLWFNDRGTLKETDGSWGHIVASGSDDGLLSNQQTALVVDRLGEVWIGSDRGVSVLDNPVSVATSSARAHFRTVRPLKDVPVRTLAVDALNRKWVGTNQGVFLVNAEGDSLIKLFTTENSPLVNNDIRSILSVDATGDVYIGTANGMNRVSTLAVAPPMDVQTIVVSPHPFVLPSSEPLRISGLPAEANVKIFTVGGTLVREFQSLGGAVALWDGLDNTGRMVPTGVYIIAAGADNGEQAAVGKVAVIRQ